MDGVAAIIMLFVGIICASAAVSAYEEGKGKWLLFFTALSLFNLASFLHSIQS